MLLFAIGVFVGAILSLGILGFIAVATEERELKDAKFAKELKNRNKNNSVNERRDVVD